MTEKMSHAFQNMQGSLMQRDPKQIYCLNFTVNVVIFHVLTLFN